MYEFASGVINVLEKQVFDKLGQERMLKAPDKESAFAVLFDTDLGGIATKEKDIEKIITGDMGNFKRALEDILKEDKQLARLLFLRFDALNLKIVLKLAFKEGEPLIFSPFDWGSAPYQKLKEKVNYLLKAKWVKFKELESVNHQLNDLIEKMIARAVSKLDNLRASGIDSKIIEHVVDQAYLETKLEAAIEIAPLFEEITKLEIDISNIKNLVKSQEKKPLFICGGSLTEKEVEKLIELKEGEIAQDLEKFLEVLGLSVILEKFSKDKSITALETSLKSFLTDKIFTKEKETGTGIAKVLAYFHKKMNAYANIRLIMFSKQNNIAFSEIEQSLLPI